MLQSSVSCDMLVLCFVIITNTMAYWYDGAALAATRSPVIALFWCLIKFTTTTIKTNGVPEVAGTFIIRKMSDIDLYVRLYLRLIL